MNSRSNTEVLPEPLVGLVAVTLHVAVETRTIVHLELWPVNLPKPATAVLRG